MESQSSITPVIMSGISSVILRKTAGILISGIFHFHLNMSLNNVEAQPRVSNKHDSVPVQPLRPHNRGKC